MTDVLGSHTGSQAGDSSDSIVLACPECGTVSTVHADRRLATDFCPTCDYPLFWARPSSGAGVDRRRRPTTPCAAPRAPRATPCPRPSRAPRAPS